MSDKRRKYTREFKREAVRLARESGKPAAQVARDLGIHREMLYRWKNELKADGEQAFPGSGHLKEQDAELHRLRQELALVQQERDILKKALAIFSKEPK
jgi:transposase